MGTIRSEAGQSVLAKVGRRGDHSTMHVAAIDVGSNGVKFSVARVRAGGEVEVVERDRVTIQIGANLERTGEIGHECIQRLADTVAAQCLRTRAYAVDAIAVVGTAAAREAADAAALQRAVGDATGERLTLISGEQEARLTWEAVQRRRPSTDRAAMIDVGGGSTEFVIADGKEEPEIASVPLGAVRLAARFATEPRWPAGLCAEITAHIQDVLERNVPRPTEPPDVVHVTGGTASLVAMMELGGLPLRADVGSLLAEIDGASLDASAARLMADRLSSMELPERAERLGVSMARARMLPTGCLILSEALAWMRSEAFVVNELGIRDGIMLRLAEGRSVG